MNVSLLALGRRFVLLIGLLCAIGNPRAMGSEPDAPYLDGLRQRGLYELAEKYCSDRLADATLSDSDRAMLTIQLSRTLADHARIAQEASESLWQKANEVVDQFSEKHPRSSRTLLIQTQAALTRAARGEAAREQAGDDSNDQAMAPARTALRQAIAIFDRVTTEIATRLRQVGRTAPVEGDLTIAELQSLAVHVNFEKAKALRIQALCYPAGSADRINSLTRAGESLRAVLDQAPPTALTTAAALEDLTRLRLLGEYGVAERRLESLAAQQQPADIAQLLRAERIRLALARDRIDDALAEAGVAAGNPRGPEVEFARLEAFLSAWRRAAVRQVPEEISQWQRRSIEHAAEIGRLYGEHRRRQAQALLAQGMSSSGVTQSAEMLSFNAAGFYRGKQFAKALSSFDAAARMAQDNNQPEQAFDALLSAATIEKEQRNFRSAADRYRSLALDAKENPRAPAVHMLAAYCAAQLAQESSPPDLDRYEMLLREHVLTWPQRDSTAQVYSRLGRLAEHRGDWPEAIKFLELVRPGNPAYDESAAAIGRCYEAWLHERFTSGQSDRQLADRALASLESIAGSAARPGADPSPAAQTARFTAARIWLAEIPTGALPAERLLRTLLDDTPNATSAEQLAASRFLVAALVMQGKHDEADRLMATLPQSTSESLALLDVLAGLRARHSGSDLASKLAERELAIENQLLASSPTLEPDLLRAVQRRRALTLAESGQRAAGLQALEQLARDNPRDGQTQEDIAEILTAGDAAQLRAALVKWTQVAQKSRPATPRWFRAHLGLASTQFKLSQFAASRETIDSARRRFPQLGGPALKARFDALTTELDKELGKAP